jgi:hypothetical protein
MSQAPSPRWIIGILAIIVAAVAIGTLGWMLWPRLTGDVRTAPISTGPQNNLDRRSSRNARPPKSSSERSPTLVSLLASHSASRDMARAASSAIARNEQPKWSESSPCLSKQSWTDCKPN